MGTGQGQYFSYHVGLMPHCEGCSQENCDHALTISVAGKPVPICAKDTLDRCGRETRERLHLPSREEGDVSGLDFQRYINHIST